MLFMQDEKFLKEIDAVKEKVDNRFLKIKLIITILRNRTASELCYLLFYKYSSNLAKNSSVYMIFKNKMDYRKGS